MHQKWKNLINVENPSSNLLRFTKLMKNKGRMQVHFILDETQVFLNKMNETNLTKNQPKYSFQLRVRQEICIIFHITVILNPTELA